MSGSLKVGIGSPSLEDDMLAMEMGALSLLGPRPQRKAPIPQPTAFSPKVLAFFQEQRRIGASWPKALPPLKYDISVYRLTDVGCYSSIDSSDWRKRELSRWETEVAIGLIDNLLRTQIAEATKKACEGLTAKNAKEKFKDHYVNTSLHFQDVPNIPLQEGQQTKPEYTRFKVNLASKTVLVAVPQAKLLEIAKRVLSFPVNDLKHAPGPVLGHELEYRMKNIFTKFMQPEFACLCSLIGNPNVPKIHGWKKELTFAEDIMDMPLEAEIAWNMRKQGMDPRLVDSLVESYILDTKNGFRDGLQQMILHGDTGDGIGGLSW